MGEKGPRSILAPPSYWRSDLCFPTCRKGSSFLLGCPQDQRACPYAPWGWEGCSAQLLSVSSQGPEGAFPAPAECPGVAPDLLDFTATEEAVPGKTPGQAAPCWPCGLGHILDFHLENQ